MPFLKPILDSIAYTRLLATFEAVDEVELPVYKGATFRGCLGDAFRRLVCKHPGKACEQCRLQDTCLFALMYSRPLREGHPAFGRFTLPPRPYIIEPMPGAETHFATGSRFWFELLLIGDVVDQLLPVLPAVMGIMGELGMGHGRGRFRVVGLQQADAQGRFEPLPAVGQAHKLKLDYAPSLVLDDSAVLHFDNPLRLLSERKPMQEPPEFDRLVGNLALRMALLGTVYCGADWQDYEQAELPSSGVAIASHELQWANWQHFSGTKKLNMHFDGHVGRIAYKGNLAPWAALLAAGQVLHAGSTATFGLGKFRVESL